MSHTPKLYKSKPHILEAMQFDGTNGEAIAKWCGGQLIGQSDTSDSSDLIKRVRIEMPLRSITVSVGAYVIRDDREGEFWAWRAEHFEEEYEPVTPSGTPRMEPDVDEPYTDTHRLLARAINRAGIDALANTPDYTLARKLLPELFGEFVKLFTIS